MEDTADLDWMGGCRDWLGAMALTMLLTDMSLYMPVFHVNVFWLILVERTILRSGLRVDLSGRVSDLQS